MTNRAHRLARDPSRRGRGRDSRVFPRDSITRRRLSLVSTHMCLHTFPLHLPSPPRDATSTCGSVSFFMGWSARAQLCRFNFPFRGPLCADRFTGKVFISTPDVTISFHTLFIKKVIATSDSIVLLSPDARAGGGARARAQCHGQFFSCLPFAAVRGPAIVSEATQQWNALISAAAGWSQWAVQRSAWQRSARLTARSIRVADH